MGNTNLDDTMPIAPLKIIALDGYKPLADKINEIIVNTRKEKYKNHEDSLTCLGYDSDSYLVNADTPRFGSGEGKGIIYESVRGKDIYILADVMNYNKTYKMAGMNNRLSPDDHFQDLKRMIYACNGKAHRINVIIPFLYESRQHKRTNLESLDAATALQELTSMGVKNIITFDAHDPRVANAVPIDGFENFYTSFQFIQALLAKDKSLLLDSDHLMMISPDEGGMSRAIFYANILGIDVGMFYKRRDFTVIENGKNPIVAHEFLGTSVEGKVVFIVDDMIASGESILEVAKELKKRSATKVYITATFGLFTEGFDKFDEYYEKGIIDGIFTTNLIHCPGELLNKPYYTNVDISKYIALIIDKLNHDISLEDIQNATSRIHDIISEHKMNSHHLNNI